MSRLEQLEAIVTKMRTSPPPAGMRLLVGDFRLDAEDAETMARLFAAANECGANLHRQQDLFGWLLAQIAAMPNPA